MMTDSPAQLAVVAEEFTAGSPAQHLLDRFLIGYPAGGDFRRPPVTVTLTVPGNDLPPDAERRVRDFSLLVRPDLPGAVAGARAILVVWRGPGHQPNDALLQRVLAAAAPNSRIFVHGALGSSRDAARHALTVARQREVQLLAGSPLGVTWRLPEIDLPRNARATEALVVVQGPPAQAEWHALECLFPVIERRRGGEAGVRRARALAGDALWDAAGRGEWSWDLLGAALSRSDTPQGESITDGRTQDLVGLGQVQRLARSPRGWLLDHHDGFRSALLVLDGVVADYNFAVQLRNGGTVSAQIHRPPPPPDHQYSRLAGALESFLLGGNPPWSAERPLAIAETVALLVATAR